MPGICRLYWGYICSCLFLHWFGKNFPIGGCLITVLFAMGTCIVAAEFCPREYGATYNLCPVYADWRSIQEVAYSVGRTQKDAYTIYSLAGIFALAGCEGYLWLQHRRGENVSLWYDHGGLFLLSLALFGFAMFLVQRIVPSWSVCHRILFGIYLIHNMIALMMMPWLSQWNSNLYLKMILTYLLVWGIAWGLVRLIGKIPYVGDWILYKRRLK